jgi:hypothetical protein
MTLGYNPATPLHPLAIRPRPLLTLVKSSAGASDAFVQGTLPLTYPLPSGVDAVPQSSATTVGRVLAASADVPAVHAWASRFMQAVIEVVAGDRPLTQLARWTSPTVYEQIGRVHHHVSAAKPDTIRRSPRHQIATVHVCQVTPIVTEVAARVVGGRRSRALAARLDFERERWTCTAFDFG